MSVEQFLLCRTPESWVNEAIAQQDILLIDHANCEKKAASTALNLMYRYVEHSALLLQLSKLAREELRHFEQVVRIMKKRNITYEQISSARYAGELRQSVRTFEPARLTDILIVSAVVEARSCERFSRLVTVLDDELAEFYASLLKSEARHFEVYLDFASRLSSEPIDERVRHFLARDQALVEGADSEFRFHSGVPVHVGNAPEATISS